MLRRSMLQQMGLWALGAPILLHGRSKARANPLDSVRRLVVVFTPNGPQHVTGPTLERQQSALDLIGGDCSRLRNELDGSGREMLEFHCDNISSLQASVAATLEGGLASCEMPAAPPIDAAKDENFTGREQRDMTMDAYEKLMALAFTCDVTRVIGISIGSGASRFHIPESYGVPASGTVDSGDSGPQMHAWTHQSSNNPDTMQALGIFYNWFSSRIAGLLDTLETTMDADGRPLMDTTLVMWTSEFGAGGPHSNDNVPVMLFGGSEGRFSLGRQFEIDGDAETRSLPLHALFVSLAHHMGLTDVMSFGNAGRGPLEWLEG